MYCLFPDNKDLLPNTEINICLIFIAFYAENKSS